jgi:hypothetical protein
MQDFEDILEMFEDYTRDPRPMDQEPRNMYSQGQLVSNTVDGSRPGYSGDTIESNISKSPAGNFQVTYKQKYLGTFNNIEEARKIRDTVKKDNPPIKGTGSKLLTEGYPAEVREILDSYITKGKDSFTFKEVLKSADITSPTEEAKFRKVFDGVLNRKDGKERYKNLKMISGNLLNEEDRLKVQSNFDLPEGQTNWDFDRYKYGVDGIKNELLMKKIIKNLQTGTDSPLAATFGNAKGWMSHSMYRVYKNQTEPVIGSDGEPTGKRITKKGVKLTYEPLYGQVASGETKITGFKDNTAAGKGGEFYASKKHEKKGAANWDDHLDYEKVNKMVDITKRVGQKPSEMLQKLLTEKGFKNKIRLNDILSYDRYYTRLSEISPKELIKSQIVKHHSGGVGARGNLNAAATKDIQLLTGANNATAVSYENIVNGTKKRAPRALTTAENNILKNMGAKITGIDGTVYGGGSLNPDKQFALIEKQAADMIKKDTFNVKTVASYLEKLGCGKSAGGRIKFNKGTTCAIKGKNKLEQILLKGAANETESSLANNILKAGKGLKNMASLKNLFGPAALAFGVATEAGFVGYDMLSSGKPFKQAVGDSLFNYMLGDKTKIDSDEVRLENYRNLGIDTDKIIEFENGIKEIEQMGKTYGDEAKAKNTLMMSDTTSNPRVSQSIKDKSRLALEEDYKEKQLAAQNLTDSLNKPETQERFDKIDFNLMPNLIESADQRVAASQVQKPSTTFFNKSMQTIFPKTNFMEDRDKTINYQPVMQEYYRGQQFNEGGLAGLMKKYYD